MLGGIFNQFLKQLSSGDEIRDWRHASRLFVDSLYRLSPKIGSLYHVFVDLNEQVTAVDSGSQIEIGMMAKRVQLPSFQVQTQTHNAYNRKNIQQERIQYAPVTMAFHDDSADLVRKFWYDYYSYYYRDSDHVESSYHQDHKYKQRQQQNWGFTPLQGGDAQNYIKAIRIYSLHQKAFSSYILMRPTITNFTHGEHTAGEYVPVEHTMTVEYETVLYEQGPVNAGQVVGFGELHYDKGPSPLTALGGGTTSILGPGGLVDGIGSVTSNFSSGNFGAAGLGALRTFSNFKNADLKSVASGELAQTATNVLKGRNTQSSIFVPTRSSIQDGLSKSSSTSSLNILGGNN